MKTISSTPSPENAAQPIRCAVYARVSVNDAGESEFTSVDAQVEACCAYIASHRLEGWVALESNYEDQGYSGSTIDRPGLKSLLADMGNGKVDDQCRAGCRYDRSPGLVVSRPSISSPAFLLAIDKTFTDRATTFGVTVAVNKEAGFGVQATALLDHLVLVRLRMNKKHSSHQV